MGYAWARLSQASRCTSSGYCSRLGSISMLRMTRARAIVFALLLLGALPAGASHLGDGKKHRIVYQLDDAGVDKARFVLNNIRNHVKGVGGFGNIEALELVVFGPALRQFVTRGMDAEVKQALETLQADGVVFGACGN